MVDCCTREVMLAVLAGLLDPEPAVRELAQDVLAHLESERE